MYVVQPCYMTISINVLAISCKVIVEQQLIVFSLFDKQVLLYFIFYEKFENRNLLKLRRNLTTVLNESEMRLANCLEQLSSNIGTLCHNAEKFPPKEQPV